MCRMTGYDEEEKIRIRPGRSQATRSLLPNLRLKWQVLQLPAGEKVIKGTVVQVLDDEVMVDVGGKSEGVIPLRELSLKEVSSARDLVQVGDEIEVLVLKWDDDGTILLSKKKWTSKRPWMNWK